MKGANRKRNKWEHVIADIKKNVSKEKGQKCREKKKNNRKIAVMCGAQIKTDASTFEVRLHKSACVCVSGKACNVNIQFSFH